MIREPRSQDKQKMANVTGNQREKQEGAKCGQRSSMSMSGFGNWVTEKDKPQNRERGSIRDALRQNRGKGSEAYVETVH